MNRLKFIILSFCITFASCYSIKHTVDSRSTSENIQSQRYKFTAKYAIPLSAGFQPKSLTSGYELKITQDTIQAYLPYFGRAYEAPFDFDAGIKFVSTEFDYKLTEGKKQGNWIINIRIKDQHRGILLKLDCWDNGSGTLFVRDESRQPILFNGDIE
ncbi:MAG: DUF4251 domain-containing protein [Paludibacteraceae bacterium]